MAPKFVFFMSLGSMKKERRYACLLEAKASHSHRMCAKVSSSIPHLLHIQQSLGVISSYTPWWILASSKIFLHFSQSCDLGAQFLMTMLNPCSCWVVFIFSIQFTILEASQQTCFYVSLIPNPQPGGPGYLFLSGSSPLTCLAWEALPVVMLLAA
jgi:hypothetical protein